MVDFRSRGSEANSVPATGDDSSTKFIGISASDAVCSFGVDLLAVCLAGIGDEERKKAN
jgi:hypothetical protein